MKNKTKIVNKVNGAFQIKVVLKDSKPVIWRRFLVPTNYNLGHLHTVIQMVMGWTNSHLHQFEINRQEYASPDYEEELPEKVRDEKKYKLIKILVEGDKFSYDYDFGDGWRHNLFVEKLVPLSKDNNGPVCLTGENTCPPEDCGGIHGYYELLETVKNPDHPDYEEKSTWLGRFDSAHFDLDDINTALKDFSKDPDADWSVGI